MTENSDAVVLVVSEETGIISIAHNGEIFRYLTPEDAAEMIKSRLIDDNSQEKDSLIKKVISKFSGLKKEKNDVVLKEEENNDN